MPKLRNLAFTVKYVKVNTGLSFEQKYNELESLMLHIKFHQIGPLVPGKNMFKCLYNIYGHGSHLGHVTSIILMKFHFLIPKSLHTKFC